MESPHLKPVFWDVLPILFALALTALPFIRSGGAGDVAVVYYSGERVAEFPLDVDTTFTFDSAVGPMTIAVADGAVSAIEASCPKKICVATGAISRPGAAIVCVPGDVAIVVEGRQGLDGTTR